MLIGIYCLTIGEDKYVGQSQNISCRIESHISALRRGRHQNQRLQEAYDANDQRLSFSVLELCRPCDLIERESIWIHKVGTINRSAIPFGLLAGAVDQPDQLWTEWITCPCGEVKDDRDVVCRKCNDALPKPKNAKRPCERCEQDRVSGERFCKECRRKYRKEMMRSGYLVPLPFPSIAYKPAQVLDGFDDE